MVEPAEADHPNTNGTDTTTFFPETDPTITSTTAKTMEEDPTPQSNTSNTNQTTPSHLNPSNYPQTLVDPSSTIHLELTYHPLQSSAATSHTRSPTAGANVLFLGTTRSYFLDPSRPVSRLSYSTYPALALRTLLKIATTTQSTYGLERIYIAHRLGEVAVGEESIVVAVSAAHRGPAWKGAEELLEQVKAKVEIWKREWFVDGAVVVGRDGDRGVDVTGKGEVGVWRDNRESDPMGVRKVKDKDGDGKASG